MRLDSGGRLPRCNPISSCSLNFRKEGGRRPAKKRKALVREGSEPAARYLKFHFGNPFTSPGRLDISFIERSPHFAGIISKSMPGPIKCGAKVRLKRSLRNQITDGLREQGSGVIEIWLEIAQDSLVRLP